MPDQIYIGNAGISKGLIKNPLPFNIDNDAFPTLDNFYTWRGRVKRKRGTYTLGQLEFQVMIGSYGYAAISLDGSGNINLITVYSLGSQATITPGTIEFTSNSILYTDALQNGTLQPAGSINYATGAIHIPQPSMSVTGTFSYYPQLPVLGLEDFVAPDTSENFPLLLAFDTLYSYQYNTTSANFYNVNYYKTTKTPFEWSGANYQQFWTTNYQSALWATNNKSGFNFEKISTITPGTITTIATASPHGLISTDWVWFNEVLGDPNNVLNTKSFQVTVTTTTAFTVVANTSTLTPSSGIFQTLTKSIVGQDGIKWYDGDPTSGTGLPSASSLGWVNFAPPLTALSVSIDDELSAPYYLVGALAIVPFKDRLLFFSPWIQSSSGAAIQLQDVVIWSWNGTPYYSQPVPTNETFDPTAYYVDQTGKGGWISAGISQPIATISNNEDVLLVGFGGKGRKTRFAYTGNDLQPFLFFNINSELPSNATFSSVSLDRGAIDLGIYGLALTDQQSAQRIDLAIPDEIFQVNYLNNGIQRINGIRDYQKEWIYFAYTTNTSQFYSDNTQQFFPNQTLLFNYRENSWAILKENFTCHGNFRRMTSFTWETLPFPTWNDWTEPWNSGSTTALVPQVVAGNPQGYVLVKAQGTGEGLSGMISSISNSNGVTQITSYNHCVNVGDYLYVNSSIGLNAIALTNITNAAQAVVTTSSPHSFVVGQYVNILGVAGMMDDQGNSIDAPFYLVTAVTSTTFTIDFDTTDFSAYVSGGTAQSAFNMLIGEVTSTPDIDTFIVDLLFPSGAYLGLGQFARLSQPLLLTKQFNLYWDQGRQMRLDMQQYLLDTTNNGQCIVNIYLSQSTGEYSNSPPITTPLSIHSCSIHAQRIV